MLDAMSTGRAETPIAFIASIVRAYERYGVDPQHALMAARVPKALLRKQDARVTAEQLETFSGLAMRELDDEALGWFSRRLRWGTNGMLSRASLSSPDLRIALSRWCRHYALLVDDIRIELTVDGGEVKVSIHEEVELGDQREFCLISTLRNLHGLACWLTDSRIPLKRATFPYGEPRHSRAYGLMFRGALSFEAPRASLSFDAAYLELPVRRDDRDLRAMLERPLPLLVLQYRRDRLIAPRVRELLRTRSHELSNATLLARALNSSTRTLYRQLAEEGTSLQKLKNEVRRETAVALLTRTRKPLKQIAAATGFRNEASFHRAFRSWTGQSPGAYRLSLNRAE